MPAIVTDNCNNCRFTECVSVCPVECFHADETMVYVDRDTCIDCCACIPVCPVQAIYMEAELPADKSDWISINTEKASQYPVITGRHDALPGADEKRASLGF
ncbi:ferredoxin family protein (plasmid) [Rhizobium sp. CB3090]|uniref:ferredoxin family protein n=1 Tax=Rhizobium sp. CB3090 TaxID=3039156 RepID=UPI0024B0A75E|nr:ferredoxin family protein [Rhizobium sp. CB3090]WFU12885.1 ferredoxin family protein [Rhizobium sp. CB3090]